MPIDDESDLSSELLADESPSYKSSDDVSETELREAFCGLFLLGEDPFLRMQAWNVSAVDQFIMEIEREVLSKLIDEERTPVPEALFLSAQSQMWIFAVYEILRTWRQRVDEMIKWHENGGLQQKLDSLEKDLGYQHFGRSYRASQVKLVLDDPALVDRMRNEKKRTHFLFRRLDALRVSLAKHEVKGKRNSIALAPGYGRINQWCGSLDYELENGQYSMGYVNRRDIADDIRGLLEDQRVPTDEEIASFEEYMRGPVPPDFG